MNENLQNKIEDVLHSLESWSGAYPESIFSKPTSEDFEHIYKITGCSERLHGEWARHFIKKGFEPAIDIIKTLTAELDKQLEKSKWFESSPVLQAKIDRLESQIYHLSGHIDYLEQQLKYQASQGLHLKARDK